VRIPCRLTFSLFPRENSEPSKGPYCHGTLSINLTQSSQGKFLNVLRAIAPPVHQTPQSSQGKILNLEKGPIVMGLYPLTLLNLLKGKF
jgi:hypothetical protein